MNKAKKKKQVAADPLQEAPNPMCPCEPAAPPVETFDERVVKATRSMSPEKTRVTRLCMMYGECNEWCAKIRRNQRLCYQAAKNLKRAMSAKRRRQNLVPKARDVQSLLEREIGRLNAAWSKERDELKHADSGQEVQKCR